MLLFIGLGCLEVVDGERGDAAFYWVGLGCIWREHVIPVIKLTRSLHLVLFQASSKNVPHYKLLDLSCDRRGKFFNKFYVTRDLEVGELSLAELFQLKFIYCCPAVEFDPHRQLLAHPFVRHSKSLCFANVRVSV